MDHFPAAVAIVLGIEGPASNDPRDPGGETVYGIARNMHPEMYVNGPPTYEAALVFYHAKFWDRWRCGEMPWGWALAVFDCAVNQAENTVGVLVQEALKLKADNVVGDQTIKAVNGAGLEALDDFMSMRAMRYLASTNAATYEHGWFKRLFKVQRLGAIPPA